MATFEEYTANLQKKNKKEKSKKYNSFEEYTNSLLNDDEEDIGPVSGQSDGYFQLGALSGGLTASNIGKTILGTYVDINEDLTRGGIALGERIWDGIVTLGPTVSEALHYQNGGGYNLTVDQAFEESMNQAKAEIPEYVAKDLLKESEIAKKLIVDPVEERTSVVVERDSTLGAKGDDLVASSGDMLIRKGLSKIPVIGPGIATTATGLSSLGGEAENAFRNGATYEEALLSGIWSAGAEIGSEAIGGIKFGNSTLTDGVSEEIVKRIPSKFLRTLGKWGFNAAAEGAEEVVSGGLTAIGQKLTYASDKELDELFSSEDAWDNFVAGTLLGGGFGGVDIANHAVHGVDYATGLTKNEQKVFDKVYNDAIAEQEADGKKLTAKEKAEIYDSVSNALEKGYIDTDTIESTLGGDNYTNYKNLTEKQSEMQKEYDELYKMKNIDKSDAQIDRQADLKLELSDIKKQIDKLKPQIDSDIAKYTQGSKLAESYNEKARKGDVFTADLTKYDAKQKEVVQKAMDSGILNNTNRTHDFVDMVAKISAEKGVSFDFTNNQKLKDSGFAVDGKTVNGFVNNNNVTLNIDSAKSLNSVVGHEITHVLEGTELYGELQSLVKEYARTKGEYQSRLVSTTKLYKGIEGADIDAEITADLIGDYLFTDSDFISRLSTEKPNIFKRIFDEIKYLYNVATAGSKEARELEKVKKAFEKAYRESRNASNGNTVQYSLNKSVDNKVADRLTSQEWETVKSSVANHQNLNHYFQKTEDGGIIVPVNNKLVYTDANMDSPGISKIVEFESEYETDIDYAREEFYAVEKGESTVEEAYEIIRLFTKIENINEYETENRENDGGYDRRSGRGKGQSDTYHNNFLQERIRRANETINAVNNEKASSQDGVFFDAESSDVKYSFSENVKKAEEYFGTTYNINEAGYLLTDGKLLDFSDKKNGAGGGYRVLDHRDISDAFDGNYGDDSYSGGMIKFMQEGNIRLSPESQGINLSVKPSKAQLPTLDRYISRFRGEITLDIDDASGNTVVSVEYPKHTYSKRIIDDINAYFDKGVIPESPSSLGQFRYSLSSTETDQTYLDAVNRGDTETAQKMVDETAKKAGAIVSDNGKTVHLYHGTSSFGFTEFNDGLIFTTNDSSISAGYTNNKGWGNVRKISEVYTEDDGTVDTLIKNAKNVLGLNVHKITSEEQNEIRENIRSQSDELSTKVNDVWTGEALDAISPGVSLDNDIAWVLSLPGSINENIDDFGELVSEKDLENWLDHFDDSLPRVREYFSEHRDELKDTPAWDMCRLVFGYELSDFAIHARYKFLRSLDNSTLVGESGGLASQESTRKQIDALKKVGSYDLYGLAGNNPLVIDGKGNLWTDIPVDEWGGRYSTDSIGKRAKEKGYTSVQIKDIYDMSMNDYAINKKSDVYIFFDSRQVKSADPVTYDDNGEVIPLSERFNVENSDIRNSLSGEGDHPAQYGNYNVYGKDISLNQDIAPTAEETTTPQQESIPSASEDVAPTVAQTPVEEVAPGVVPTPQPIEEVLDVAPTTETVTPVQTEEVAPKSDEKVAKVLVEEQENGKKKSNTLLGLAEELVDKGLVFEILSKKTKNRNLEAKWNYIRYADGMAQNFIGNGADGVRPLADIQEEVNKAGLTEKLYEYVYHKHNIDRMSLENRYEDVPNKAVFGDSVTADVSREVVSRLESQYPELKKYANEVYAFNNHLRQMLVDGGVISQETADLWSEMYPNYVPIRRAGDVGLNINVPLDTGRTGINAPVKKAVGGSEDILPLFDTMAQRAFQTYKAVAKNRFGVELKNTLGTTVESEATDIDGIIEGIEAQDELLKEGKYGKNPTFTVFDNGEKVTFEITEDMYNALKPTNKKLAETYKIPNLISNIHRSVLTEFNPAFLARNIIKDAQDVLINSQHPARTYKNFPKAISEMAKKGKWFTEYMKNGGEQNTYFDREKNTFKKEKSGLSKAIGIPFEAISNANNAIERLPRLAEYIASRESGRGIEESMLDAARVTTNFVAGGDFTKYLNRNGVTFLNASVQGFTQQVRNFAEAKMNGFKGWAQLATKFAVAGLPVLLLNGLMWDDDEEYDDLSDYVKQNYYIVAKYGDGKFVRIPKGRTVAVIQDALQQTMNSLTGDDEADWKAFADLFVTNLAPNNPVENNILAPIIQAKTNTTWYGDDLVPTRLQDLPPGEQSDESTDAISKWLGEKTNISPYKINYLIDQYTGVVGDVVLPMFTPEAESGDDSLLGNLLAPVKNAFTTDSVMNNQNVSDFYDTSDELTTNAKKSYATDEDVLANKYFNSVKTEVGKLYAEKREIQNSDLSDSEKYYLVREAQKKIDAIAKETLSEYEDVRIDGGYASVGDMQYRKSNNGWEKLDDKQVEKQNNVISSLGISASEYWNNKTEYDFAYESPGKYAVSNVVGGYDKYTTYADVIGDFDAKDENGNTVSGLKKSRTKEYIFGLDLDYGQKALLYRTYYDSQKDKEEYDSVIKKYLNSRDDVSYDEIVEIYNALGIQ